MSEWLDSWTKPRRIPRTFAVARRYAMRQGHAADELNGTVPPGYHYTIDDTRYILTHGKRAWREHRFGPTTLKEAREER